MPKERDVFDEESKRWWDEWIENDWKWWKFVVKINTETPVNLHIQWPEAHSAWAIGQKMAGKFQTGQLTSPHWVEIIFYEIFWKEMNVQILPFFEAGSAKSWLHGSLSALPDCRRRAETSGDECPAVHPIIKTSSSINACRSGFVLAISAVFFKLSRSRRYDAVFELFEFVGSSVHRIFVRPKTWQCKSWRKSLTRLGAFHFQKRKL